MPPVRKPAAKAAPPKRATIEQIRQTAKVGEEEVFVPAWGATVLVRGLSFEAEMDVVESTNGDDFNARLLAACIVDPPVSVDDATAILQGPAAIGNLLIETVNRCNGEGASEEALKTFPAGTAE